MKEAQAEPGQEGKKEDKSNRWHFVSTELETRILCQNLILINYTATSTSTKWALTNCTEWSKGQNVIAIEKQVPEYILKCGDLSVLRST